LPIFYCKSTVELSKQAAQEVAQRMHQNYVDASSPDQRKAMDQAEADFVAEQKKAQEAAEKAKQEAEDAGKPW